MRFAELDAVTIDAFGTLVQLVDPVPALCEALAHRGVRRDGEQVRAAFAAEAAYYRPRSLEGRDAPSLAQLRDDCTAVFLDSLGVELGGFAEEFVSCIRFEPAAGAAAVVRSLRERGLALAVVANWDAGLDDHLRGLGLAQSFDTVVTSAAAGAAKPDAHIFEVALERLGAAPERALHVGDEDVDERGAAAAGVRFAPAPLAAAFAGWSA